MIPRLVELPKNQSYFVFGPRGTGKSTLMQHQYSEEDTLFINLLESTTEDKFRLNPDELTHIVSALSGRIKYVVIDEIQKITKLLDIVHHLIETTDKYFVMSGSSARKLKHGGANLLAGRAFVYHLHPFSYMEIEDDFDLTSALQWGMLPKIFDYKDGSQKSQYLMAYSQTYLKEEIWAEQFIRKFDPFRKFLEVAAQSNGKIINFTNISKDVGSDVKTVQNYYSILEDTMLGFYLDAFQHSFRKRLNTQPKFYFFDVGVTRALSRQLSIPLQSGTFAYGDAFEHFIILECMKLASYFKPEYRFSYIRTKDDAEIDLVVERPGEKILFIEIKSKTNVNKNDLHSLTQLSKAFGDCEAICLSNDPQEKMLDKIRVIPWKTGIEQLFKEPNSE